MAEGINLPEIPEDMEYEGGLDLDDIYGPNIPDIPTPLGRRLRTEAEMEFWEDDGGRPRPESPQGQAARGLMGQNDPLMLPRTPQGADEGLPRPNQEDEARQERIRAREAEQARQEEIRAREHARQEEIRARQAEQARQQALRAREEEQARQEEIIAREQQRREEERRREGEQRRLQDQRREHQQRDEQEQRRQHDLRREQERRQQMDRELQQQEEQRNQDNRRQLRRQNERQIDDHRDLLTRLAELREDQTQQLQVLQEALNGQRTDTTATTLQPTPFKGDRYDNVITWLEHYDQYATFVGWTECRKRECLPLLLKEKASRWYKELNPENRLNWGEIRERMIQHFGPQNRNFLEETELMERKQGQSETVHSYAMDMAKRLELLGIVEPQKWKAFVTGLRTDIKIYVLERAPANFAQAEQHALQKESINRISKADNDTIKLEILREDNKVIQQTLTALVKQSHTANQPMQPYQPQDPPRTQYNQQDPPRTPYQQQDSPRTQAPARQQYDQRTRNDRKYQGNRQQMNRAPLTCFRCGSDQHLIKQCDQRPTQSPVCWHCGKVGHRLKQCRLLNSRGVNKYNNQQRKVQYQASPQPYYNQNVQPMQFANAPPNAMYQTQSIPQPSQNMPLAINQNPHNNYPQANPNTHLALAPPPPVQNFH